MDAIIRELITDDAHERQFTTRNESLYMSMCYGDFPIKISHHFHAPFMESGVGSEVNWQVIKNQFIN